MHLGHIFDPKMETVSFFYYGLEDLGRGFILFRNSFYCIMSRDEDIA